ncbi:hypothetical protein BDY24DRAFT_402242 [Mrakia frigida]|uniref:NAD(P)-dependent alcohol dehydrogenase n=1 Tax=Mrakia frigida TaxID=29902 RepID=UPI003FCBF256
MSSSDYPSSPFQIPTYRLAYTFTKPSYPPSTSIHRSELEYLPPSEDEITIEVAAAGLNPVDIQMSNFWLFNWQKTNVEKGVGQDYSGVVIAAGTQAIIDHPHFTVGTPVFGLHITAGTGSSDATLSTHLNLNPSLPASSCILPLPQPLSFTDAASIPLVWLTSYTALVEYGLLDTTATSKNAASTLVILGASGGTGSYAVQIAKKLLGVGTVVAVCSGKNEKFVRGLGADEIVDYTKETVLEGLRRLRPEGGYTFIYDCVGGTEIVYEYQSLLDWGGGGFCTIVGDKHDRSEVGGSFTNLLYPIQPLRTFLGWLGLRPRYHCINLSPSLSYFAPILSMLQKGTLEIPIEGVFPFTDKGVEDAFRTLDGGRSRGKVVVSVRELKERVD